MAGVLEINLMPRPSKPFFRSQKNAWYARINGKVICLKIYDKSKKEQAYQTWHQLMSKKLNLSNENNRTIRNIFQLVEDFLNHSANKVSPTTLKYYRRFLQPFSKRYGNLKETEISAVHIMAFANKPTWHNSTKHGCITTIKTALRWANLHIQSLIIPPKESKGAEAVINEKDAKQLIKNSKGDFGKLLQFLWLTGCRPSEALDLKGESFDEKHSIVILKTHKTYWATNKPRFIYLCPKAKALLAKQKKRYGNNYLFLNGEKGKFTLNNATNILWRLNRKLGLKTTLYGFRHTYATDGLASGIPETHVAELLGHRSTKMLQTHYAHLCSKASSMLEAVKRIRS